TVAIGPGDFGCAVWRADRLTIAGAGMDATRIRGPACAGKGLFVTEGRDITVRDLALIGAAVPDHNGAGIRAEGANLTVARVRFEDDQNGILAAADPRSTLTVRDSLFLRDGACIGACAHGLYADRVGRLVVAGSRFTATRQGHHIKSRALATEITGCDIEDGPDGTSSYLIDIPNGGAATIRGNRLEKGPRTENRSTAIMIGEEGAKNPTPAITVAGNDFRNASGTPTVFVRNRTATPAALSGNTLSGPVIPLAGPGTVQ
ncbi:MAG: hypothetical protein J0I21_15085, partial [Alphaproteobacteria bacterium]|nr:hypothetical protein [Alphaproteobacteria bacterium]